MTTRVQKQVLPIARMFVLDPYQNKSICRLQLFKVFGLGAYFHMTQTSNVELTKIKHVMGTFSMLRKTVYMHARLFFVCFAIFEC